jgi:hypothetical protein
MSQYGNYKVDLVELEKETKKLREKYEATRKAKRNYLPNFMKCFLNFKGEKLPKQVSREEQGDLLKKLQNILFK